MSDRESNDEFELHLRAIHAAANDDIAAATDVAGALESFKQRAYAAAASSVSSTDDTNTPERAALVKATDLLLRLSLDQNTRIPNHTYRDLLRVLSGRFPRRRYLVAVAAAGFTAGIGIVIGTVLALGERRLETINLGLAGVALITTLIAVILGARTVSLTISANSAAGRQRFRCDIAWPSGMPKVLAMASLVWFTARHDALPAEPLEPTKPTTDGDTDKQPHAEDSTDLVSLGRTVTRSRKLHRKKVQPGRPDARAYRRPPG